MKIPVEPKDRDLLDLGDRHGIFEPAFDELNLVAQKTEAAEVVGHFLDADRELRESMKLIAAIAGILGLVWRRQPLEGIEAPYLAVFDFVSRQNGGHHDAGPAAPDAGFDEVTGNLLSQDQLAAFAQGSKADAADHRKGLMRPIPASVTLAGVEHRLRPWIHRPILVDCVDQDFLHQLQVSLDCLGRSSHGCIHLV